MKTRDPLSRYFNIDGIIFKSIRRVFLYAKFNRGWEGSEYVIQERLKRGVTSWDELVKPSAPASIAAGRAGGTATGRKRQAERQEMAAVIEEMNKRKAAIKAATLALEEEID